MPKIGVCISEMKINPHLFCISFDFHYLCIIKVHAHKGYHPYIGESGDLAYNSYASQFDYRITTTLSAITKAILI